MMTYPQVQSQAQRELDKIVGRSRLPQFEDRDQLPYVGRVLKEVLRWKVVAPLGLLISLIQRMDASFKRVF